jgi:hypothetical protein
MRRGNQLVVGEAAIKAYALDHHATILGKPPPEPVSSVDPFDAGCYGKCDPSVRSLCAPITSDEFDAAIKTAADKAPGDDRVRAPHIKSLGPRALESLHGL